MEQTERKLLDSQADRVEVLLMQHKVPGAVCNVDVGPRLVRFCIRPWPQTKYNRVRNLAGDIALALGVPDVRVDRDGKLITLEFARANPQTVAFDTLLAEVSPFPESAMLLGRAANGAALIARLSSPDVAQTLISGTTGAGKSVLLRTMALSAALRHQPTQIGMVAIDLKGRTFPAQQWAHLSRPVATTPGEALSVLRDLVHLMELRDKRKESLPRIAVFIDELADLVMQVDGAVDLVTRLVQRGREAGLHAIAATQYPAAAILSGLMRANFPLRLVGRVVSADDARVASGRSGTTAHTLGGRGDFLAIGPQLTRFQVPLVEADLFAREIAPLLQTGRGVALAAAPVEQVAPTVSPAEQDAKALLARADQEGRFWKSQNEAERWLFDYNGGNATYRTKAALEIIAQQGITTTTTPPRALERLFSNLRGGVAA